MTQSRRQVWLAASIFFVVIAALWVPVAFGASTSWEFETATYDYGPVILGSGPTEPHEFVLTNTGETTITAAGWRISWRGYAPLDPELFAVTSDDCHSLEPQESCLIAVSFDPVYLGPKKGMLRIRAMDEVVSPASVELKGEGIGPWVSIEPEHLIFEPVEIGKGASPAQSVTVENQGTLDLKIDGIFFTDLLGAPQSPSPFQITGGSCHEGGVVVPGGNCTIEIVLSPVESGFFQSRLVISDDASDSPQSIEVQGTGTVPSQLSQTGTFLAVRITHRPARVTAKHAATFWFSVAPAQASKECKLDHLGFRPCFSPIRYARLSSGRHEFQVRIHDSSNPSVSAITRFHWWIRRHH
jgi:hypothetical protein